MCRAKAKADAEWRQQQRQRELKRTEEERQREREVRCPSPEFRACDLTLKYITASTHSRGVPRPSTPVLSTMMPIGDALPGRRQNWAPGLKACAAEV